MNRHAAFCNSSLDVQRPKTKEKIVSIWPRCSSLTCDGSSPRSASDTEEKLGSQKQTQSACWSLSCTTLRLWLPLCFFALGVFLLLLCSVTGCSGLIAGLQSGRTELWCFYQQTNRWMNLQLCLWTTSALLHTSTTTHSPPLFLPLLTAFCRPVLSHCVTLFISQMLSLPQSFISPL